NGLGNSLAGLADLPFDTGAGVERGPSTGTFGASLVVLAALARTLAGGPVGDVVDALVHDVHKAALSAERVLTPAPDRAAADLARWLGSRRNVVTLGRGSARAAAEMGALVLKEAARLPAEALGAAQFRHGPLE